MTAHAAPDEDAVTMAVTAGRRALDAAGIAPERASLYHFGHQYSGLFFPRRGDPDRGRSDRDWGARPRPSTSRPGVAGLTMPSTWGSACGSGRQETALVIGSDACSRFTDWTNRGTCLLFGDGAGAVVLGPTQRGRIIASFIASNLNMKLTCETEFNKEVSPFLPPQTHTSRHYLQMDGPEIFKFAVNAVKNGIARILELAQMEREEIDYLIIHQGNYRILETAAKFAQVPMEKVYVNINRYPGNTSAASVPIALHEALGEGKIKEGDKVLLVSFGAGATWGAALLEWGR